MAKDRANDPARRPNVHRNSEAQELMHDWGYGPHEQSQVEQEAGERGVSALDILRKREQE